ncbi:MAG TPA: helix-turn-helix domain-containing protein [Candidatus Sulfotelmatobacter sp.]
MSSKTVDRRKQSQAPAKTATPRKNAAVDNPALYITRKQAAQILQSTTQFVDKLMRCGILTAYRMGFGTRKQIRIRRDELLHWMDRNAVR